MEEGSLVTGFSSKGSPQFESRSGGIRWCEPELGVGIMDSVMGQKGINSTLDDIRSVGLVVYIRRVAFGN